jgi:hypothetical protein
MSNDFDPLAAVSATAGQPGEVPEIRISAADRPPGDRRREALHAGPASTAPLWKRARKTGATLAACALAGLVGWGLYRVVAPQSAGWLDAIAAKTVQLTAPPVDLVPVTQRLQAEIDALQKKVEALEKSRSANAKSLASVEKSLGALDGMKTETRTEIDALSGRVAALQQETNAKLSELSARQPARRRGARPVQNRAAPAADLRQRQAARRNDAFDPTQHPGAPGAPRPLGVP